MKTSSAKAKGRKLQQYTRDSILHKFPELEQDDVKSTSMGAGGEDVQLSPAARKLFPYTVECKSRKAFAGYAVIKQAEQHENFTPLCVVKANNEKPLAMLYLEDFMKLEQPKENEDA
jgi:hypothetical protein